MRPRFCNNNQRNTEQDLNALDVMKCLHRTRHESLPLVGRAGLRS